MPALMGDLSGGRCGRLSGNLESSLAKGMIGGYPGSEELANTVLNRIPREELLRSWILTEPGGPRNLSPDILHNYRQDLKRDYEEVGAVDTAVADYSRSFKQHVFKPKQPHRASGNKPPAAS